MKKQKYYSTDQVIEIIKSMQVQDAGSYIDTVTNVIITALEQQRPLKNSAINAKYITVLCLTAITITELIVMQTIESKILWVIYGIYRLITSN